MTDKPLSRPNEYLIETIEKALKKATPGEWYVHEDEEETCIMAVDPNVNGRSVSVFGFDPEINFTSEDALLIANAPEWLRTLLEERERVVKNANFNHELHEAQCEVTKVVQSQLQQTREELEQLREDKHQNAADMFHDLNTELVQAKAERDKWKDSAHYWSNAYHALPILAKLKGEDKE